MKQKLYFAKRLPIEGEIPQQGDWFTSPSTGVRQWTEDIPATTMANIPMVKKVKLFLCSRDIQVGDDVYYDVMDFPEHPMFVDSESRLREVSTFNPFKKIGEISPDATWVKEGDEFDEDEVRKFIETELYWADAEEQYQNYHYSIGVTETFVPTGKQTPTYHETLINERIEIKGPCGHFH